MKYNFHIKYYLILLIIMIIIGCHNKPKHDASIDDAVSTETEKNNKNKDITKLDSHSSMTALDWEGVYQGVVPCADCEGIKTCITLLGNYTYTRTLEYLGKSKNPIHESGVFNWDETGAIITLGEGQNKQKYKVGEHVLFHLNKDGYQIEGDLAEKYKLMKNYSDLNLENKKWMLTELMGQKIDPSKEGIPAFVMFQSKQARVSGNNGCNLFSGHYSLKPGYRIEVGQMMNTLMACENMDVATQFMAVLQKSDNYSVVNGVLHLNKAKMAPLAKFTLINE